jgi:transporter family protein
MSAGWVALLSTILIYGAWGFFAKIAQQRGISSRLLQAVTVLAGVALVILLLPSSNELAALPEKRWGATLAFLGGVTGALGYFSFYKSIETLDLSVAGPLSSLYLLVTVVLAILFLAESVTLQRGLGIAAALLAGIMLSRPRRGNP